LRDRFAGVLRGFFSDTPNGHPKDTHDHPNGVWTLPPDLDADEADKEKHRQIGESDRMVLKFRKPAH